ncbi:hypothetical protein N657DRAFT_639799 [Parathielavia appendiculata]|uniref:Uncharacterized protein n=1 Tax=Parathielavia appendiculata TaxID=2587402 RepID=A0AAN6Z8R4_9PEZI|nr:hypothetical protein N657DRAFT_639799 [Parathielavia appendiculata]
MVIASKLLCRCLPISLICLFLFQQAALAFSGKSAIDNANLSLTRSHHAASAACLS